MSTYEIYAIKYAGLFRFQIEKEVAMPDAKYELSMYFQ